MTTPNPAFEFIEHTADIRMRVTGESLERLFTNAAHGMMSHLFSQSLEETPATHTESISVESPDPESLLVDWLSRILLRTITERAAVTTIDVEFLNDRRITAVVGFANLEPSTEIKAVTRHGLTISKLNGGFQATIIFDI